MADIIPAIMPTSFEDLEDKLSHVATLVPLVQIDIMDGRLTPKRTWPHMGNDLDRTFVQILNEQEGFPFWNDVDFEADLMVKEPEKVWRDWITVGAKRLIFHYESIADPKSFLETIRKSAVAKESPLYTEIGFAINVSTRIDVLFPFLDSGQIDFVQCMGIAEIGFQGSVMDESVFGKISDLRAKYPDLIISVDGGVNMQTAPKLVEVGVDRLVIGSAIFAAEDVVVAVGEFKEKFEK